MNNTLKEGKFNDADVTMTSLEEAGGFISSAPLFCLSLPYLYFSPNLCASHYTRYENHLNSRHSAVLELIECTSSQTHNVEEWPKV